MAQVNFGGMLGSNKSSMKGVASGIDSEALINSLVEKRAKPIHIQEDKISINNEKIAAFGDLASKLNTLQGSLTNLKGLRFSEDGTNALEAKNVSLFSTATSTPNSYLNVSADYTASLGALNVTVDSIAKNKILKSQTCTDPTLSATNAIGDHSNTNLFTPGTFAINGTNITVSANDSLNTIVSNINNVSGTTGVSASVIYTGSNYVMMLQSNNTGISNAFTLTDASNVLNSNFTLGGSVVQSAADASLTINNSIQVTRASNVITDAINGVTFTLNAPIATAINVNIGYDHDKAADAIENFIASYNDFIKFTTQQQGIDKNGEYYETAKIKHNDFLSNLRSQVETLASSIAYLDSSNKSIGIHYVDSVPANPATKEPEYIGLMSFDRDEFVAAFNNNPTNVQSLFEFKGTCSSANFYTYKRGSNISNLAFNMNIDVTRPASDIVHITYGATTVSGTFKPNNPNDLSKGGVITGAKGSMFDGYQWFYSGSGVETANLTVSQGIMDKIYNSLNVALDINPSTGESLIQNEITSLVYSNTSMQQDILQKQSQLDFYKEGLVNKYSMLEAAVVRANTLLTMMDIQMQVMSKK